MVNADACEGNLTLLSQSAPKFLDHCPVSHHAICYTVLCICQSIVCEDAHEFCFKKSKVQ